MAADNKGVTYNIAKVTSETYQPLLIQMYAFCGVIMKLPVNQMIAMGERAKTASAILDPTLLRMKGPALEQDLRMLRAMQHVQQEMAAMQTSIEDMIVRSTGGADAPANEAG